MLASGEVQYVHVWDTQSETKLARLPTNVGVLPASLCCVAWLLNCFATGVELPDSHGH
jgi:hypothetical protein